MRHCTQCGAPLSPDARFCGSCGAAVVTDRDPQAQPKHAPATRSRHKRTALWIAGALLVLAAGSGVVYAVFGRNNTASPRRTTTSVARKSASTKSKQGLAYCAQQWNRAPTPPATGGSGGTLIFVATPYDYGDGGGPICSYALVLSDLGGGRYYTAAWTKDSTGFMPQGSLALDTSTTLMKPATLNPDGKIATAGRAATGAPPAPPQASTPPAPPSTTTTAAQNQPRVRFTNLAQCVLLWNSLGMKAGPIPNANVNVALAGGDCEITPSDLSLGVVWHCSTTGDRVFHCPNQGSSLASLSPTYRVWNATIAQDGTLSLHGG
jgi:hypothetical protein